MDFVLQKSTKCWNRCWILNRHRIPFFPLTTCDRHQTSQQHQFCLIFLNFVSFSIANSTNQIWVISIQIYHCHLHASNVMSLTQSQQLYSKIEIRRAKKNKKKICSICKQSKYYCYYYFVCESEEPENVLCIHSERIREKLQWSCIHKQQVAARLPFCRFSQFSLFWRRAAATNNSHNKMKKYSNWYRCSRYRY